MLAERKISDVAVLGVNAPAAITTSIVDITECVGEDVSLDRKCNRL